MTKTILLILAMGANVMAGPYYDLAMHSSSATMKLSGDIKVAASSSSANSPTIVLNGAVGSFTGSGPLTLAGSTLTVTGASSGGYGLTVSSNVLLAGTVYTRNGNMGIGINPLEKLHIDGVASPAIRLDSSVGNAVNIYLRDTVANSWLIQKSGLEDLIFYDYRGTPGNRLRLASQTGHATFYDGITTVGTVTVQGSAFSVGGSTLSCSSGVCSFGNTITGSISGNAATATTATTASTATYLATAPGNCTAGQYISGLTSDGTKTCGTPSGSGDVVLAATQTFTGQNTFTKLATISSTAYVSGNLGVGAIPETQFHVRGVTGASQIAIESNDGNGGLNIYSGGGTGDNVAVSYLQNLRIGTASGISPLGGFSEKVRIDSSGNVGIGTTSPDDMLDLEYGSPGPQMRLTNTSAGGKSYKLASMNDGTMQIKGNDNTTYITVADGGAVSLFSSLSVGVMMSSISVVNIPNGTTGATAAGICQATVTVTGVTNSAIAIYGYSPVSNNTANRFAYASILRNGAVAQLTTVEFIDVAASVRQATAFYIDTNPTVGVNNYCISFYTNGNTLTIDGGYGASKLYAVRIR